MGMVILLLLELKGACPTSDAWTYPHLQHGCVQQLSACRDIEASRLFVKSITFICSSRLSSSFLETCDISGLLHKILKNMFLSKLHLEICQEVQLQAIQSVLLCLFLNQNVV